MQKFHHGVISSPGEILQTTSVFFATIGISCFSFKGPRIAGSFLCLKFSRGNCSAFQWLTFWTLLDHARPSEQLKFHGQSLQSHQTNSPRYRRAVLCFKVGGFSFCWTQPNLLGGQALLTSSVVTAAVLYFISTNSSSLRQRQDCTARPTTSDAPPSIEVRFKGMLDKVTPSA